MQLLYLQETNLIITNALLPHQTYTATYKMRA